MAYSPKEISTFKETILEGLSKGKSLKSILEGNDKLPERKIVYKWLNESSESHYDAEFRDNYARAREDSADLDAETIQEIAEKTLNGTYDPASARVAVDALKWAAGKKQPKKYGDRLDLNVSEMPKPAKISFRKSSE